MTFILSSRISSPNLIHQKPLESWDAGRVWPAGSEIGEQHRTTGDQDRSSYARLFPTHAHPATSTGAGNQVIPAAWGHHVTSSDASRPIHVTSARGCLSGDLFRYLQGTPESRPPSPSQRWSPNRQRIDRHLWLPPRGRSGL